MASIRLDSGIKEIAVENEKGDVVSVLRINIADNRVFDRFMRISDNLNHVSNEFKKEAEALEAKYENGGDDLDRAVDTSRVTVRYINRLIDEIDGVFGQGTVQNVCRENYDINPDYLPDEGRLYDLVEGLWPVMLDLYGKRREANSQRFGVSKRGKKTH